MESATIQWGRLYEDLTLGDAGNGKRLLLQSGVCNAGQETHAPNATTNIPVVQIENANLMLFCAYKYSTKIVQ